MLFLLLYELRTSCEKHVHLLPTSVYYTVFMIIGYFS